MNWFLMFDFIAIVYLISGLLCLIVWNTEYRHSDDEKAKENLALSCILAFLFCTIWIAYGAGRIFS